MRGLRLTYQDPCREQERKANVVRCMGRLFIVSQLFINRDEGLRAADLPEPGHRRRDAVTVEPWRSH